MSRHKRRLERLANGRGNASAEELRQARLDRMTDEEIAADIARRAVGLGFDADLAEADPNAAIAWVEEQVAALAAQAVEAGFDAEVAERDPAAAAAWYAEVHGGES